MARRKKSYTGERLTAGLHSKCTPSERRRVDAAALTRGVSLSDYVRRAVLRRPIDARPAAGARRTNPDAAALWREAHALGVNLNQIAHKLHTFDRLDDVPELRELCREIKAVFARIMAL
jgi:hypothetical protein